MENELPRLPSIAALAKIAEAVQAESHRDNPHKIAPTIESICAIIRSYQDGIRKLPRNFFCPDCMEDYFAANEKTGAWAMDGIRVEIELNKMQIILRVQSQKAKTEVQGHGKLYDLLRHCIQLDGIALIVEY